MVDVGKGSARVVRAGHQEVGRGRRPLWEQRSELWSTVQAATLHFGVSISALLALLCGHTVCVPLIADMGEGSLSNPPSPFKVVGGRQPWSLQVPVSSTSCVSFLHTGP